jgi:dephospho-CoA kinase
MYKVGLTGGIGSGKSIVAEMFMALGAGIIDTDVIARDLVAPGSAPYDVLLRHFGNEILLPDDNLNRSLLREIIFNDAKEKQWLEDLLHPLIRDEVLRQIEALKTPYCIIVIPLLTETYSEHAYPYLDRILAVDCEPALQAQRAMERDGISQESVQAIIQAQAKREDRLKIADDIIVNDQHIERLREQVEKLHKKYLAE